MVFRLPTHLESFIPPPSEQMPLARPWRGTLLVTYRSSDHLKSNNQELRVTAVETDGDNHVDLWPQHLAFQPIYDNPILRDVQAWTKRHAPPICTFLPDRLRDANENAVNQANFRSLSRILFESQMVAIAFWNAQDRRPAGSIVLYPAQNSTALLVGAIFLATPLPDFIAYSPAVQMMQPMPMSSRLPQHIDTVPSTYGPLLRSNNSPASMSYREPHLPHMASPISADVKQDPYRFLMPRSHPSGFPGTIDSNWPVVKQEEPGDLPSSSFQPTHRYGRNQEQQYPL